MTKTVFVLGAGASKEVNLPIGSELKNSIADRLKMPADDFGRANIRSQAGRTLDRSFWEAAQSSTPRSNVKPYWDAANHISDAMPQAISIDNFINNHAGDLHIELCAKLAIVSSILEAESESLLQINRMAANSLIAFGKVDHTWYNDFFQLLTEDCQLPDLAARLETVALVVFNYDRCFEHYMHSALQNYYRITSEKAADFVDKMEIYHPYGKVGSLTWAGGNDGIDFGATPTARQLLNLARQIRTFTEGMNPDSSDIVQLRSLMATSPKLVFLGFAFHSKNMELLFDNSTPMKPLNRRRIFATAHGISSSDIDDISRNLTVLTKVATDYNNNTSVNIINTTCSKLFHEYKRSLSFS